ncbi:carboxylate--amine ligase [Sphingopyxis sp. MWB1]|uniref:carboxylate--amine ligase n=1 Tax=Sphingopyxis sp. MWB1 TaxID=1537715 RepID=UPI000AE5E8C2|nr:ATP-grasp domain-containing protein [Sphingopyxis sp. MWB1]
MIADDIGVFLSIARSLGRAAIMVDVATCGEDYPGLASRYVHRVHALPPYLTTPEAWVEALIALVRKEAYRLIIPSSDSSLDLLAVAAARMEGEGEDIAAFAIASPAVRQAFSSKAATRALAEAQGVAICPGRTTTADPAAGAAFDDMALPLIIKPSAPYLIGGREAKASVRMIKDRAALVPTLAEMAGREIVVEEFFDGEGVGLSVLAEEGAIRLAWQHRRLAQSSATGRSSRRVGEPPSPVLQRDVERLCRATRLTGVAMFEFRQNRRSGAHVLLEVNPRFWGSLPLALAAGADFPLMLWRLWTGQGAAADPGSFDYRIRKSSLLAEVDRLSEEGGGVAGALRKGGGTALLLLKALFRPAQFDGWTRDDPAPHRVETARIIGRLKEAILRRLRYIWS